MMPVLLRLRAMRPSSNAPSAGYRSSPANEAGGKGRSFCRLDRTHRQRAIEIEIDGPQTGLLVGRELRGDLFGGGEGFLDGGMQPPSLAPAHQERTGELNAWTILQLTG